MVEQLFLEGVSKIYMGIFDFFKTSYSSLEQQILDLYTKIHESMGLPHSEARKATKQLLDKCIEEAKQEGSYDLPGGLGEIILETVSVEDPKVKKIAQIIRQKLPIKRTEGVKDKDIRWWWNLNDIERRMMVAVDDVNKLMVFSHERQNGVSEQETAKKVRKYHAIYGDPKDTTHATGDDRPLPYELKERVNIYIEKRAKSNIDTYKKEIKESSTFNALIRKEIKAGNI